MPPPCETPSSAAPGAYVVQAWMVTLPNGWWSVHLEHPSASNYAARNHGVCEPLYRKVPAQAEPSNPQPDASHDHCRPAA